MSNAIRSFFRGNPSSPLYGRRRCRKPKSEPPCYTLEQRLTHNRLKKLARLKRRKAHLVRLARAASDAIKGTGNG